MSADPDRRRIDELARRLDAGLEILLAEAFGPDRGDAPPAESDSGGEGPAASGRFDVLGEIGRGGMGIVLHATDSRLGRDVALKVLQGHLRDHPEATRRFLAEARIGASLQHPGIVPVYDIGLLADGSPYLAMKLVRGRTLASLLRGRASPETDRTQHLRVFLQVCQTVAFAHARGVVHRDLKPSNVLAGDFGEVQVLDWGLAGTSRGAEPAPRDGEVTGTYEYMPPEQARGGEASLDARSDVFALGAILCEILTGGPAYPADSRSAARERAARADLADALARIEACGADQEIRELARTCLSGDPEARPRNAGEVAAALGAHLAAVEERAAAARLAEAAALARADESQRREAAARRARAWIAALGLLAVASVTAGFGIAWTNHREVEARRVVAERAAGEALARAHGLLGQAARDAGGDLAAWEAAHAAAQQACAIAGTGPVSAETRSRAEGFLADIGARLETARLQSRRDEADARLRDRLDQIAAEYCEHFSPARLSSAYEAAFRDYGIDPDAPDPAGAADRIRDSRVADDLIAAIEHWGMMLVGVPQPVPKYHERGRRLLDLALRLDPDPVRRHILAADATGDVPALVEAARELEANRLGARTAKLLVFRLGASRDRASRDFLRAAVAAHPGDFWLNLVYGSSLNGDGVPWLTAAVALRPDSAPAVARLAMALRAAGRPGEARALLERVLSRQPGEPHTSDRLSMLCSELGEHDAAEAAARQWIAARPRDARAHFRLFVALERAGRPVEATAALEDSVALDRGHPERTYALALRQTFADDERAEATFGDLLRADPRHGGAHYHLGLWLLRHERFDEAVAHFEAARELDAGLDADAPAPGAWITRAEWMRELAPRVAGVLAGGAGSVAPDEAFDLAHYAWIVHRFGLATELFERAFAHDPALAADLAAGARWIAARSAALAAAGRGLGGAPPAPERIAGWLERAAGWLREEVAALELASERSSAGGERVARLLDRWLECPDLEGLRGGALLAALPEERREAIRAAWADAAALRRRVE